MMRMNEDEDFECDVTVADDPEYDDDRRGWDYRVKDTGSGVEWQKKVAETNLERPPGED